MRARFAMVACALALACESPGARVTAPAAPRLDVNGVSASVTGNALFTFVAPNAPATREAPFSFTGRVRNGVATGEWVNFDQTTSPVARTDGEITALYVEADGHHARLCGTIVHASEAAQAAGYQVGMEFLFRVYDAGPGTQAPGSTTALLFSPGPAPWFIPALCALSDDGAFQALVDRFIAGAGPYQGFWTRAFTLVPVERGNLTVHRGG